MFDSSPAMGGVRARSLRRSGLSAAARNLSPTWTMGATCFEVGMVWNLYGSSMSKKIEKMIKSKYEKFRPQELLLVVQNQGIRMPQPYTHHFCEPLGMLRHP